jgi:hypothetical protein
MKKMTAFIVSFLFAVSLFSLEVDVLKSFDVSEFPLTHNIEWKDGAKPELDLLPNVPGTERIQQRFSSIKPEITVEKLYKIPLGSNTSMNTQDVLVKLANIFGNPEAQTKYLYDSSNRNQRIPLIEEAYICNSRGKKLSPLTFVLSDIPGTFEYYQYVDEANFSGMVVNLSLNITDQYVYIISENVESLKLFIFPLIPKESIYMDNFMFVEDGNLYVYSITQLKEDIKIKQIGSMTIYPAGTFGKRMDVMGDWINGELAL